MTSMLKIKAGYAKSKSNRDSQWGYASHDCIILIDGDKATKRLLDVIIGMAPDGASLVWVSKCGGKIKGTMCLYTGQIEQV